MNFVAKRAKSQPFVLFIVLMAILLFSEPVFAQRVSPMVFELEPFGSKNSRSLRVENTKQIPLTVEITASKLDTNELGEETLTDAEDDFLIFPPQMIVQPGKTQIVRVKYIGEPQLEQSQAYRIAVKQLPINLKKEGQTNIGIAFNFYTLLNITPKKTQAKVTVDKVEPVDNNQWQLTLNNSGNRFVRLSTTQWKISELGNSSKTRTLKSNEVSSLSEINFLAPKQRLILNIPKIDDFDVSKTQIAVLTK